MGRWLGKVPSGSQNRHSTSMPRDSIRGGTYWPLSPLLSAVYFSESDDDCEINQVVVSGATRSGFGAPYDGIEALIVERPDANGPYGAKEAGEGPLHSTIPAIVNAVYHAIGVRFFELPLSPARVRAGLRAKG